MKKQDEYIADDRLATPEYFEKLKNMTDREFSQHINNLKEQEALETLRRDWPEYDQATDQKLKDGESMVKWLSNLESFA